MHGRQPRRVVTHGGGDDAQPGMRPGPGQSAARSRRDRVGNSTGPGRPVESRCSYAMMVGSPRPPWHESAACSATFPVAPRHPDQPLEPWISIPPMSRGDHGEASAWDGPDYGGREPATESHPFLAPRRRFWRFLVTAVNASWAFRDNTAPQWDQGHYLFLSWLYQQALDHHGPIAFIRAVYTSDPSRAPLLSLLVLPLSYVFGPGPGAGLALNVLLWPVLLLSAGAVAKELFGESARLPTMVVLAPDAAAGVGLDHRPPGLPACHAGHSRRMGPDPNAEIHLQAGVARLRSGGRARHARRNSTTSSPWAVR